LITSRVDCIAGGRSSSTARVRLPTREAVVKRL
jgi:hypothetical protein